MCVGFRDRRCNKVSGIIYFFLNCIFIVRVLFKSNLCTKK